MKKNFKYAIFILVTFVTMMCAVVTVGAFNKNKPSVSVPENVKTVNLNGSVMVTWENSGNADGYFVYRQEKNVKKVVGKVTNGNRKIYIDKSVVSGGKYNYTVSAYKKNAQSVESKYSRNIYLSVPKITSFTVARGGMVINWDEVKGAESYTVYRSNGRKNEVIAKLNAGNCTYKDTGVLQGEKYRYAVVANNTGYKSGYQYKTSPVYVAAPKLKSTVNGNGYVSVSWYPVFKADKYKVYRKVDNSQWSCIGTFSGENTTIQDKNVVNGKVYTYTVRTVDGNNFSGFDGNGIDGKYVDVPKNIKVYNSNNCLSVNWASVENATKYAVYRKDNKNANWKYLGETTTTTFTDKNVQNGEEYTYTVRARGENGGFSWFLAGTKLMALKAPALTLNCTPDSVTLSWSEMETATEYYLYRKAEGAKNWTCIRIIKGTDTPYFADKNVSAGKTYTYTIKQVRGNVSGSYNAKGYATKYYAAPTVDSKLSPNGILLIWNKAPVGTGYEIDRMTESNKKWTKFATVKGTSTVKYTDSKATYGEMNYYRIRVTGSNLVSYSTSIYGIDPNKPAVALTYDDGPYTPVTNRILDVLEKYDSRATFFVVGSRVNTYADCIKREAALGCEIANHTYNHKILTSANNDVIKSEIQRTNDAVKKLTGKAPTIVRAPGGSVNARVKSVVGYPLVNWTVDTLDWKNSGGVVSIVKNNVRDGSIVLMHDLYGSTASATEVLVPWLVSEGYQLVTVTELMELKGIYMEAGEFYTQAY